MPQDLTKEDFPLSPEFEEVYRQLTSEEAKQYGDGAVRSLRNRAENLLDYAAALKDIDIVLDALREPLMDAVSRDPTDPLSESE